MRQRVTLSWLLAIGLAAGGVPAAGVAAASTVPKERISWAPCPGSPRAECGTLRVPVDWSRPHGAKIAIAVARRSADSPGRRLGTLFYNPGGPGDGGVKYVTAADTFFSATLRARFDIVSMDPRGIGGSTPIECGVPVLTPTMTFFPRTRREFTELRKHNRAVARSCLQTTGALVRHADTISVARDHEALRVALGVAQVNWLGLSYGTQLAANYAQLYPGRTRAMVLDAALEHSGSETLLTAEAIRTAESAFNRFARWCAAAADCVLRGQDVAAIYDRLVENANRDPIPVPGALRPVTGDDIRMATPRLLALKEPNVLGPNLSWAALSQAIKRALSGDALAFALPPFFGPTDPFFGIGANACGDWVPDIGSYQDMQQRIEMGRRLAPHLQGASEHWQFVLCIGWPVKAANPPHQLDLVGVPTLIVHSTHDPSVSYKWAFGLAAQIRNSDILTRTGDGHTSYYTSSCARAAMDAFLLRPGAPTRRVCVR